ncbi:MAG: bifunctional DNA-formamidopyrimidine glycosylase/DNA-(apurinic or apyrimidinic site) lyase [Armatimonadetes bacterium]|nr:MAG: bifunctional DNA-formamidopyrimidine glycosylase/DNA-(apurinic or apyrimidinic site) lyase [Armatimonadota bacterium]
MPELPEVEVVRMGLEKYIVGKEIVDVEVLVTKIFIGDKKNVIGAKIVGVDRIGKVIVINLNNDYSVAIHLKLTGQLIYRDKETENLKLYSKVVGGLFSKFTCVIFKLRVKSEKRKTEEGSYLYYNDIRKFGWVKIIQKSKIKNQKYFRDIGVDALRDLTTEKLGKILSSSSRPVKLVLMDQKKIAGVGNIYANEALFVARIDPRKNAKSLSSFEAKKLYGAMIEVLKKGLKYGGASDANYVNALGQDGKFQEHFLVYGREGEKCLGCGGMVEKFFLGGRGTYFCQECQK